MRLHRLAAAVRLFLGISLLFAPLGGASAALAEYHRTKIAVLDFAEVGGSFDTPEIGTIAAEWFTTGLVRSGRFDVVERAMLQRVMAEQQPGAGRAVDRAGAAALGRALGVKAIAAGSVSRTRHGVEVESRIIAVDTGEVIAAENFHGRTEAELHGLVDALAAGIIRDFPLSGYVVKRTGRSVVLDLGLESDLAPGAEFVVYREGAVTRHPKTGEVLDVEQVRTGRIRIVKISRNVAEGKIIEEEGDGIREGQLATGTRPDKRRPRPRNGSQPRG